MKLYLIHGGGTMATVRAVVMTGRAIGYCRVSTDGQAAEGVSMETQRARIADYCAASGWELVDVLDDAGISGGDRSRFDRMIKAAQQAGASRVVVYHADRFGRDVVGVVDNLRRMARYGIELHAVGRGRVEVETETGYMMTVVEQMAAEHLRIVIKKKTRDALAEKRTRGERLGNIPFGYQQTAEPMRWLTEKDGTRRAVYGIEPNAAEQDIIGRIMTLRAQGYTLRGIADALNEQGTRTRRGSAWTFPRIQQIVGQTQAAAGGGIGACIVNAR